MAEQERSYTIMVVDDNKENLRLLSNMLTQKGYRVRQFPNGEMALKSLAKDPPDLILLDIDMPGLNGYEVCRKLKENSEFRDIPVLFISALHDTEAKVKAFDCGGQDYVTKPVRFEEVDARVRTHLTLCRLQLELKEHNRRLEERVANQVKEISDSQMATIFALARLAESRDDDTGLHIERVRTYSRILAQQLLDHKDLRKEINEKFIVNIFHAAPLHDIGKVGVPDAILLKPGKLTDDEFETIKKHTMLGADTLGAVLERYPNNEFIGMGKDIARWHHEKWSGRGYPDGLEGSAIPVSARILAVADVYDALRSERPYKKPFSHEKTSQIIVSDSGSHFDPTVIEAFEQVEKEFEKIRDELNE